MDIPVGPPLPRAWWLPECPVLLPVPETLNLDECGALAPRALPYDCELPKGHDGEHAARVTWRRWPGED